MYLLHTHTWEIISGSTTFKRLRFAINLETHKGEEDHRNVTTSQTLIKEDKQTFLASNQIRSLLGRH